MRVKRPRATEKNATVREKETFTSHQGNAPSILVAGWRTFAYSASWQRKSGLFVVFSLEISNPENFVIFFTKLEYFCILRLPKGNVSEFFLFFVLRRVAHFSRDPFQSRRHVSIPSPTRRYAHEFASE